MLVLIDNADIKEIESLYNDYPYDGVTTNPTILRAAGENPVKLLKKIYDLIPDGCQLHAQLISESTEKMVEEAHFLLNYIGEDMFIKVPVTKEGMRAIPILKKEGVNITATAIYTSMQAFMAAKAGARYTAPYVNRIDNMGFDGLQVAKNIHDMFRVHNLDADVLAARSPAAALVGRAAVLCVARAAVLCAERAELLCAVREALLCAERAGASADVRGRT